MFEKTRVLSGFGSFHMLCADLGSVDEGRRRDHFFPGESLLQSDGDFPLLHE